MGKKDYGLTIQLYKDLMKAYTKVCGTCWTQAEAYERTVVQPAPRFYVTTKQACQIISRMLKGDFSEVNSFDPNRRRMYYDILNKTIEMSEKRGFLGKSLKYVMTYTLLQPAPEFYLSPVTFQKIFCFLKNGTIKDDGTRYQKKPPTKKKEREE